MLCGKMAHHIGVVWAEGLGAVAHHPKEKCGTDSPPPTPPTDAFDNTCDISAHFLPSELPTKYNEEGPPEQLPTDTLSQIDYGQTKHCEDCLCQRTTQMGILENLSRGMRMAEWKQNQLLVEEALRCFSDTLASL